MKRNRQETKRIDLTEKTIRARHEYTKKYFEERGWDIKNPTDEQVIQIRNEPEWQNPLKLVQKKDGFHGESKLYPAPAI